MMIAIWLMMLPQPPLQEDVAKLISQLRSDKVDERQSAAGKLVALGEKAEPLLKRESTSADSEVALRAKEVLATIERKREEKAWDARVLRLSEKGPDATWKMLDGGKEKGVLKTHTTLENGKLVFLDVLTAQWRDRTITVKLKQVSTPDHSLRVESLTAEGDDPALTYKAEVKKGKLLLTRAGATEELDLPSTLWTGSGMFRAVPLLPKRKGFTIKFHFLDETGRLSEESTLTCMGEEEVVHDGKTIKAWKWALVREQVIVGEDFNDYYWVTEDRLLRIRRTHDREFVLSPQEK
jgi:hypothetical protein